MLDADVELVPIVGADNAGFVQQLLEVEGLEGAAVTNSAAVGGGGVTLALQVLAGEEPERVNLTEPQIWANDTEEGIALLEEANDPDIDPIWPLQYTLEGWTDYSKEEIVACEGP
jgi:ribose transport system substrate-binding protein